MSGRISVVVALVMVFVAVALSCSKKSQAQVTPQIPVMYLEDSQILGGYQVKKIRDPSTGTVCFFINSSSISCLR